MSSVGIRIQWCCNLKPYAFEFSFPPLFVVLNGGEMCFHVLKLDVVGFRFGNWKTSCELAGKGLYLKRKMTVSWMKEQVSWLVLGYFSLNNIIPRHVRLCFSSRVLHLFAISFRVLSINTWTWLILDFIFLSYQLLGCVLWFWKDGWTPYIVVAFTL